MYFIYNRWTKEKDYIYEKKFQQVFTFHQRNKGRRVTKERIEKKEERLHVGNDIKKVNTLHLKFERVKTTRLFIKL